MFPRVAILQDSVSKNQNRNVIPLVDFTQLCQFFVAIVHVGDNETCVGGKFPRVQVFFDDGYWQRTAISPRSVESTFGGEAAEDVGAEVQVVCSFGVNCEVSFRSTQYPVPSTLYSRSSFDCSFKL